MGNDFKKKIETSHCLSPHGKFNYICQYCVAQYFYNIHICVQ